MGWGNQGSVGKAFGGGLVSLLAAQQDPQQVFAEVRLSEFVGREWLIKQVDRFLAEQPCGFVIIQADAGLGKTAVAAHLVRERGYLSHFARLGSRSATVTLRNLAAQVMTRFVLAKDLKPQGVVPGWAQTTGGFFRLLKQAAEKATAAGRRVVLVVDGVDEAEPAESGLPLGLPPLLPEGVFVIATCRPGTAVPVESPSLWVSIARDQSENTADVRLFLSRVVREPVIAERLATAGVSTEEFVTTLVRRCGGVWLYLRYLVDEIRLGHRGVTDLEGLPQGLGEYYTQTVRVGQADQRWEQVGLPVWATLAAAQEPLTLEAITRLSGVSDYQAVRRWCEFSCRPFLAVTDIQPRRYRIFHDSLREYLADRFPEAVREAHSRIADYYLTVFGGLQSHLGGLAAEPGLAGRDDGYPLRHLATHLDHAGRVENLHTLLTCEGISRTGRVRNVWAQAHEYAGTLHDYLGDVSRAQARARADTDRYLVTGQATPSLGLELLYALTTAALTSDTNQVPTGLVPRLVEAGLWGPRDVLQHILRITDENLRVSELIDLAEYLSPDLIPRALDAAIAVTGDVSRVKALGALAAYLSPNLIPHALDAATVVTDDSDHAQVFRSSVLARLAVNLPRDEGHEVLRQALDAAIAITDESDRAWAVVCLAEYLPRDLFLRALDAACAITDNHTRAYALAHLAASRPPEERRPVLHQFFEVFTAIDEDSRYGLLLDELAEHIPADLIPRAVDAATAISDDYGRIWALTGLSGRLPPEERRGVLRRAFEGVINSPDEDERVQVLGDFAQYIPADLFPRALEAVVAVSGDVDNGRALGDLAEHLPSELFPRARVAITAIADDFDRARAFGKLATNLPPNERRVVLHQALEAVSAIRDPSDRALALSGLAETLTGDLLPDALDVASTLTDNFEHAQALRSLLVRFPTGELVTRIPQASRTTVFDGAGVELFRHCVEVLAHDPHGLTAVARNLTKGASWPTVLGLLAVAMPLIQQQGGPTAVRYCRDAVRTVYRWWL